jgi:hypothetical protein
MPPPQVEANMMDRAAAWFHLLLALAAGTVIYVTAFGAHWHW